MPRRLPRILLAALVPALLLAACDNRPIASGVGLGGGGSGSGGSTAGTGGASTTGTGGSITGDAGDAGAEGG